MTQPPNQPGTPDPYGQSSPSSSGGFPPPPPPAPTGMPATPQPDAAQTYGQQSYGAGPYGGAPGGPGAVPPGAKRRRRRPHLAWWLLPGVFLLAGALMFWVPLASVAQSFTKPGAEFSAGTEVPVSVPGDGLHFIWTSGENEADAKQCVFTDSAGKQYPMESDSPPPGQDAPEGFAVVGAINADAGDYTATCPVSDKSYQVKISKGVSAGQIAAMGLSFVVGFIGVVLLIIMAVLALTGASRKQPQYPGY